MPLHLQAIIDDDKESRRFAAILTICSEDPNSVFVSKDKYIHTQYNLTDELSGSLFGRLIFTMKICEKHIEVIDVDIVLNNDNQVLLEFSKLLNGSSDSNEYYEAVTKEGVHLLLETVNRHAADGDLESAEHDVSVSAFPFQATVYDDMHAFNQWAGFGSGIRAGDSDFVVHGFSETFMMPGGVMNKSEGQDDYYSFLVGKVASFRDVRWRLGEECLDFAIVWLETALGCIPAAMGREVFDLSGLDVGKIIAMNADIKADLARSEDFQYPK